MSSSLNIPPLERAPVEIQLMIVKNLAPNLPSLHSLVIASRPYHTLVKAFWNKCLIGRFDPIGGDCWRCEGLPGDWIKEVDWAFWTALGDWYREFERSSKAARSGRCWSYIARRIRWLSGHAITSKTVKKHGELSVSQVVRRYDTGKLEDGDLSRLRTVRDKDKILSKIRAPNVEIGLSSVEEYTDWRTSENRVTLVEQANEIVARLGKEGTIQDYTLEEAYCWLWLHTDVYDHSPTGSLRVFYEKNMAEYQRLSTCDRHRLLRPAYAGSS